MKQKFFAALWIVISGLQFVNTHAQTGITRYGENALANNTTGDYNSAFGSYALYTNTSGGRNTASGYYSLFSNTSGSYNIHKDLPEIFATTGFND